MSMKKGRWERIPRMVWGMLAMLLALGLWWGMAQAQLRFEGPYPEAATIGQGHPTFQQLSDRFTALAQKKGADYAFDVLRVAPLDPGTDLHLLGHAVGGVLYQQKGIKGMLDCTQDFRNACSHAIVIGALGQYGADKALSLIEAACEKAPGGTGAYTMCFHGLGHGVFADFGYNLPQAIQYCKEMGTPAHNDQEYIQCVGGAIMELVDGGGHDEQDWLVAHTKYLTSDPLSPCMSSVIPNEAKSICLTYITPRLFWLAGADPNAPPDPEFFPAAFKFCDAIPTSQEDLRQACYGGFGKEFDPMVVNEDTRVQAAGGYTDDELSDIAQWCDMADAADGRIACEKSAVDSLFWGGEFNPKPSFRFCGLIQDASLQSACYSSLAGDISYYIRDTTQQKGLCAQLPQTYQAACEQASTSS
jgi:hypothetical protein